jgi:isocitrate dehydrogenase
MVLLKMQRLSVPAVCRLSAVATRSASSITANKKGELQVPNDPIIPFIEGDGSGADVWKATRYVIDSAVEKAYKGARKINWLEVFAGEKGFQKLGDALPKETLDAFTKYMVGIKGPLSTPAGLPGGSLQAELRKALDLYCCIRPIHYTEGLPSPVKHPEWVHCTIIRDTTEDVYSGIEFPVGSPECAEIYQYLKEQKLDSKVRFPLTTAYGIKPISKQGTERVVVAAIKYALKKGKNNVVLVHKGNIQKFTEGGFKDWGYGVATNQFRSECVTERESWILGNYEDGLTDTVANCKALEPGYDMMTPMQQKDLIEEVNGVLTSILSTHGKGQWKKKLLVRDTIADITLQQIMTRTKEFDVIVTMTLNGSYVSDALAAQVGGVGIAPGANINFETGCALFEANHGTAPKYANLDKANPGGLMLSGEMMLRYMGWDEASALVRKGVKLAIKNQTVTYDFKRLLPKGVGKELKCSEFGNAVVANMGTTPGTIPAKPLW